MATRRVEVAGLAIGGGASIVVQTMWKRPLVSIDQDIINKLISFKALGCELLRFACPSVDAALILGQLASELSSRQIDLPLVADIHFDYNIALRCLDFSIAKLRINPGNIGAEWKIREILAKAKDKNVPIRIGVNAGSLPEDLSDLDDRPRAIVMAAERELEICDRAGFKDVIVSLKASDVATTLTANQLFAKSYDVPLHIGITEAGSLLSGLTKSAIALNALLRQGIGDTLRVSLSAPEEEELLAARYILQEAGRLQSGIKIVSCPRCARANFDSHAFLGRWEKRLSTSKANITVAIMGCNVNGPGEARHADLAICGNGTKVSLYRRGIFFSTVPIESADIQFQRLLDELETAP